MDSIKYLGVTITQDLRRNTHISNMCTKANSTLWDPQGVVLQQEIEKVQNRAARLLLAITVLKLGV